MRDPAAVPRGPCVYIVGVQRREIVKETAREHHMRIGNRQPGADELTTYFEALE